MRMRTFREPLFKANFRLVVGPFLAVERYLRSREFNVEGISEPTAARTLLLERDGRHEVILWFPAAWSPYTERGAALLAHEAMHAAAMVLRMRGVSDTAVLDEVGNYFVEWLVAEILRRVVRKRR